jgi:hypothetical protein
VDVNLNVTLELVEVPSKRKVEVEKATGEKKETNLIRTWTPSAKKLLKIPKLRLLLKPSKRQRRKKPTP